MNQSENTGTIKSTISSYLWEVKNITNVLKECQANKSDHFLVSPFFSTIYASIEHKWCLNICVTSNQEKLNEDVAFYLRYIGENKVTVRVRLSLLDDKLDKVVDHKIHKIFEKNRNSGLQFIKLNFLKDRANRLLVNDSINMLCEIIYDSDLAEPLLKRRRMEQDWPDYSRLREFDEFEKLLEAENSTDTIVKIGKDEIKVHKAILMSRSPVFQAMFEHDMREKKQSIVEISDIKYAVMKEVFRFMYVGKINKTEEMAADLLVAADKYSIKGLKVLCEKLLFENLTEANVVEYLQLATTYNSDNLKSEIIKFIVICYKNVIHKLEFKALPSKIVFEVLYAVIGDSSNE